MAMKFERHTDSENVHLEVCDFQYSSTLISFQILSDDWTKMVLLQADRTVEFHTQFGLHYKTRIPRFGRDMKYHASSCDLLVGGAGNEVYRLNLDQGRFLNPLVCQSPGINVRCCIYIYCFLLVTVVVYKTWRITNQFLLF